MLPISAGDKNAADTAQDEHESKETGNKGQDRDVTLTAQPADGRMYQMKTSRFREGRGLYQRDLEKQTQPISLIVSTLKTKSAL